MSDGYVVVVVCTFNLRLWEDNLHKLPVMSELAETVVPAYASSTWTVPGTVAVLTGMQEWERHTKYQPNFAWTNLGWDDWDKMGADHGAGDAQNLVDEWDGEGVARLFYRIPHFPYDMTLRAAKNHLRRRWIRELEESYVKRLEIMDREMAPLLELDVPIIITGDHGEDFTVPEEIYMHHNNDSEEVLRVPFFGRGFDYTGPTPIINKHAINIIKGYEPKNPNVIRIWTEGPYDGEWKYIVVDDDGKTIIGPSGMKYFGFGDFPYMYTNEEEHSKLLGRLKALGYIE